MGDFKTLADLTSEQIFREKITNSKLEGIISKAKEHNETFMFGFLFNKSGNHSEHLAYSKETEDDDSDRSIFAPRYLKCYTDEIQYSEYDEHSESTRKEHTDHTDYSETAYTERSYSESSHHTDSGREDCDHSESVHTEKG